MIQNEELQTPNVEIDEYDSQLRPQKFDDFIGQENIKERLKIAITAAKERKEPLCSILINSFSGGGKTTIAQIIANEYGSACRTIMAPAIKTQADIVGILTKLEPFEILHIDEIHGLSIKVQESVYSGMEDFRVSLKIGDKQIAHLNINPFTLIGTTTNLGKLSEPLRNRFGSIFTLSEYSDDEILLILKANSQKLEMVLENDSILEQLSMCSRGVPRNCNRLLARLRDYGQVKYNGQITQQCLDDTLKLEGIERNGFTAQDVKYIKILYDGFGCGPAGLNSLAASMNEDPTTISMHIEPFLLRKDFILRGKTGRFLTSKAVEFLHPPKC